MREGLVALAKSALLLVGVPATIARLWLLTPQPGRPWASGASLPAHLVLAAVAAGWLVAGTTLVRDLAGALTRRPLDPSSWSQRWAVRLAALLLMLAAAAGAGATGRARTAGAGPAAGRPPGAAHAGAPASSAAGVVEVAAAAGLGALVATALLGRARLLRQVAAALRRPGERQGRPSAGAARLEALLGTLSDDDLVGWIDGANRLLWRALRAAPPGTQFPEVVLVRAGPDGVELLLARRAPVALDGFEALEGGAWWCLDPMLDLAEVQERAEGCGRLLPALVPVGEDGTAVYLLNVPPGHRLAITGDPVRARRALSGVVLALRCLPWADELGVELVGVDPPAADERCYHLSASSPEELEALSEAPAYEPAARPSERWSRQPLVVTALTASTEHEALLARCSHRAGIVSLGGQGDHELTLDETGAWLEPQGLRVAPSCPSPAQLALAGRLLAESAAPSGSAAADAAGPLPAARDGLPAPAGAPVRLAAPGTVELRLLDGPARLVGGPETAVAPRDVARAVEVVAYLALGAGATRDELAADLLLLPAGAPGAAERVERLLAAARAALGLGGDRTSLLARADDGRVTLRPEVSVDAARLAAAAAAARTEPPDEAARLLRAGLELVGPRPCCAPPAYAWLEAKGLRGELLACVVDAAHHLALLALAEGDAECARWAVERGRLAEPFSDVLARDLMLACDASGDTNGAAAAWAALEEGLARLGGNEPSEETRELYAALVRRPR